MLNGISAQSCFDIIIRRQPTMRRTFLPSLRAEKKQGSRKRRRYVAGHTRAAVALALLERLSEFPVEKLEQCWRTCAALVSAPRNVNLETPTEDVALSSMLLSSNGRNCCTRIGLPCLPRCFCYQGWLDLVCCDRSYLHTSSGSTDIPACCSSSTRAEAAIRPSPDRSYAAKLSRRMSFLRASTAVKARW